MCDIRDRLRKVKCDEGRPICRRCIVSGRECRGYKPAPIGNFSWHQLLHHAQPSLSVSVNATELRYLSYYHHVVAPSLVQSLDDTFWVINVPQIIDQEPSARYAVLAISALHEDFNATLQSRALGRLDCRTAHTTLAESNTDISTSCAFALQHYNAAIRMVLEDHISNDEVLLTVSLLFTCIELLQGSADAAAQHCQHGLRVHSKLRLSTELSTAFSRLSIFPQLMGTLTSPNVVYFPKETEKLAVDPMNTLAQAREALDVLVAGGARLLKMAKSFQELDTLCSLHDLKAEHKQVCRTLNHWWEEFTALRCRLLPTSPGRESDAAAFRLLETRWLVSCIMINSCLSNTETVFDEYLSHFKRIIDVAEQEKAARSTSASSLPSFSFEMGYLPFLFYVGIKCRQLGLRIRALVLLNDLSCARETIWDKNILYATATWATEVEHGVSLDEDHMRSVTHPYPEDQLPSDARRIITYSNTDEAALEIDSKGCAVVRRRICFYTSGSEGVVGPLWDCTTMRLCCPDTV